VSVLINYNAQISTKESEWNNRETIPSTTTSALTVISKIIKIVRRLYYDISSTRQIRTSWLSMNLYDKQTVRKVRKQS